MKSAYETHEVGTLSENPDIWKSIWKLQVPQKVRTFVWLIMKQALITNSPRFNRHIVSILDYDLCTSVSEDWWHAVRNCLTASTLWAELKTPSNISIFLTI